MNDKNREAIESEQTQNGERQPASPEEAENAEREADTLESKNNP